MSEFRPPSPPPPGAENNPTGQVATTDPGMEGVADQIDEALKPYEGLFYDSPGSADPSTYGAHARRILEHDVPTTYHGGSGRRRGASSTESSDYTPRHTTESRDSEPWKPAPAEKLDRAAQHTSVELLGKSYRVERAINEAGIKTTKFFTLAAARIRNTIAKPNNAIKKYAQKRAERGLDRKKARLEQAQANLDQAKANGAGKRILKRRQEAVNIATAHVDRRADRLADKEMAFNDHTRVMKNRVEAVYDRERSDRDTYIREMKQRKADALGRKALRQSLRAQGGTRSETRSILRDISQEQFDKVGMVAMAHEASRRKTAKAERRSSRASRRFDRTNRRIARTESQIKGHESDEDWNNTAANAIEHELSLAPDRERETLGQQIDRLEARLKGFTDYTEEHAQALSELRVARAQRAQLNKRLRHHQREAESSGSLAANAKGKLEWLQPAKTKRQEAAINASRAANTQWQREVEDKAALDQEIHEVLNS